MEMEIFEELMGSAVKTSLGSEVKPLSESAGIVVV